MAFTSFLGRLLFASVFILSAYQDQKIYGFVFKLAFNLVEYMEEIWGHRDFVNRKTELHYLRDPSNEGDCIFDGDHQIHRIVRFNEYEYDGGPAAKAFGPKFDVFFTKHVQSHIGKQAPENKTAHLVAATIALKGIGGILFIFDTSIGAYLLLLHQMIATPILYDFYNYDNQQKVFKQLFIKFTQNMALFGALLFFIGKKNSISQRLPKKKLQKMKTV